MDAGDGAQTTYRPTMLHRYGYLLLALVGLLDVPLTDGSPGHRITVLIVALLAGAMAWWRITLRLVVGPDGLAVTSAARRQEVAWTQITSYRLRSTISRWSPSSLGEVLVWPFVVLARWLLVVPVRALARWIWYRRGDRAFLDAVLELRGGNGRRLIAIEGADRLVGVGDALERVIAGVHARGAGGGGVGPGPIDLASVTALEVDPATTRFHRGAERSDLPTEGVDNLFEVIAACHARGAACTVASSVWLPRALRAAVAS